MAPSALLDAPHRISKKASTNTNGARRSALLRRSLNHTRVQTKFPESALLHRNIQESTPVAISAVGNTINSSDGESMWNAAGGAAVACLGHEYIERVGKKMIEAMMTSVIYSPARDYYTLPADEFANFLVNSTNGAMSKALIYNSGSEAVEAAIKYARQYWCEMGQPERQYFIARKQSYHGATLGALGLSGHTGRRQLFECYLSEKVRHISACNPYRDQGENEKDKDYIERKAKELEDMFEEIGPGKVCAFVAEPVVGAAMGSVPAPPGYFRAMKEVCDKYDALLIFDEVMCGMGRTGYLHAWEREGVAPDIQVVGKTLGAGIQPVSAMLLNHRVVDALWDGSGVFAHGHTYQNHTIVCAAALEVQNIIKENSLVQNVAQLGGRLQSGLRKALGDHPYVGNIRGVGFFHSIEFVQDKTTKEPFHTSHQVHERIHQKAKRSPYSIYLYSGNGTADGHHGDHVTIAPPYNIKESDIDFIVERTRNVIVDFFAENSVEFNTAGI